MLTSSKGPHRRVLFADMAPLTVRSACAYNRIKINANTFDDRYFAAKRHRDASSARDLIKTFVEDDWYDRVLDDLEDSIRSRKSLVFATARPDFAYSFAPDGLAPPTNAIPSALASRLKAEFGGEIDQKILQIARPGRTKLETMQRFVFQPRFEGEIEAEAAYVLVDDMYRMGGTLAALRSHIEENGGTVVAMCTLFSMDGQDQRFPLAKPTLNMLGSQYGTDELEDFCVGEIGYGLESFTDAEGAELLRFAELRANECDVQRLREEISACRDRGVGL